MSVPEGAVDLGDGHYYTRVCRGDEWVAVHEWHRHPGEAGDEWSAGLIPFTGDYAWTVDQRDPLTLSPSVACQGCGSHGFIREGRWVPA